MTEDEELAVYPIKSDIPIPLPHAPFGKLRRTMKKMKIGDSIFLLSRMRMQIREAPKIAHELRMQTTFQEEPKGTRIWRIS